MKGFLLVQVLFFCALTHHTIAKPANLYSPDYWDDAFNGGTQVNLSPKTQQEIDDLRTLLEAFGVDLNMDQESVAKHNQVVDDMYRVDLNKDSQQKKKVVYQTTY